jgi:urease accessory protein
VVALVRGESAVVGCAAASPLHLFTPRPRGRAVWALSATHGAGLVAGDAVALEVDVGAGATLALGTTSNTRVYRSEGRFAEQHLAARVAEGGTLAVLPEPTTCFAGARHRQEQRFGLGPGASLLVLDALTAGREARGESWAFAAHLSRIEIEVGGRTLLADALRLVAGEGPPLPRRMEGAALFGTVVAVGPAMAEGARQLLAELAHAPVDPTSEVTVAASPLADGLHMRLAARSVTGGMRFLRARLAFATPLLGGAPLERRT